MNIDGLKIREAFPTDVAILVTFNMEMARETEERDLDREILTKGVEGIFEEPGRGFYLVAEIEGTVVGSLMVTKEWSDWRDGDFWWIQSVFVEAEFRRQGVFRDLYEEARRMALEADRVCGCRLYVERDNSAAMAAYLRRGFHETPYRLFEDSFESE